MDALWLVPLVVTTTFNVAVPAVSATNATVARVGSLVILPPLIVHW